MEAFIGKVERRWASRLFGEGGGTIYDLEEENYRHLIGKTACLEDLLEGLEILSPLADDALAVARSIGESDFQELQKAIRKERVAARRGDVDGGIPSEWLPILIPELFLTAVPLAESAGVPLGTALVRIAEARGLDLGQET